MKIIMGKYTGKLYFSFGGKLIEKIVIKKGDREEYILYPISYEKQLYKREINMKKIKDNMQADILQIDSINNLLQGSMLKTINNIGYINMA